ncbi:hypothetical protein FOCC_FOCC013223 [Frankliniella occidentalis]|uniref:Uncharacterized protein LOC127750607 n=1 Tax=Frankliniella occidentalis TaxID=133901 RepID=A0A9C6X3U9_FRAOC|nr:uncharacterized protein LOC127750607 [Frankliniella occidentalis]KAE8741237.1 hypothetical protein FOCC_FOCC013223 [Frankliniella occidentalis]
MYSCPRCHVSFESLNGLHYHVKSQHPKLLKSSIRCGQAGCPRSLNNFDCLRRHLKSGCNFVAVVEQACSSDSTDTDVHCAPDDSFIEYSHDRSDAVNSFVDIYDSEKELPDSSDSTNPEVDFIHENSLKFIAEFYANVDLSRSVVQNIIDKTSDIISENISAASKLVLNLLKDCDVSNEVQSKVTKVFSALSKPFEGLETEHSRFVSLSKKGVFHYPESFVCGRNGREVLTGQFISMKLTLKRFLELPGVLPAVQKYVNSLQHEMVMGVISNFIQGEYWQKKCSEDFVGKFVLPLFFHFDEVEMGNGLGTHCNIHKLGASYVKCPGIPPEFQSMLENHFLVLLFHASDRKADNQFLQASNNAVIFNKVIDEMNDLRTNGLTCDTDEGMFTIYFDLGLILGDNAGLHSILGFVESFNAAFPCFICKVTNDESPSLCVEKAELLRTPDNYASDLALDNVKLTGIKEECVFHKINNFHVTENYVCDWMHDILEGICKYNLVGIFEAFIFEKKYLSIERLQSIMLSHDYGNVSNKPPVISREDFTKSNMKIRMSANEMLVFVQHLPIMIGHLIPSDDDHWKLLSMLYDIVLFLLSTSFTSENILHLDYLIVQHHLLYVKLFGETLKPKHHHLLHYSRIIKLCGPPIHFWSMRFESKHRFLKRYSNVCFSRVNLTLSIALKVELNFAFRVLCQRGFSQRFSMSSKYEVVCGALSDIDGFLKCARVKFVNVNGVCYRIGTCVLLSLDSQGNPVFGIIEAIFVNSKNKVCLGLNKLVWDVYDTHRHAYIVYKSYEIVNVLLENLPRHLPVLLHTLACQTLAVSLRHAL